MMKPGLLLILLLLSLACTAHGSPGNQMRHAARRRRTTTRAEDIALAQAAADATLAFNEPPASDAAAQATAPEQAAAQEGSTDSMQGADPAAAAAAEPAAVVAAAASPCSSGQFEWPTGTKYCWYKRDSGGVQQGPGSNVFKAANVAVNSNNQLVLNITNPTNNVTNSSCAEIFTNKSYGYGEYIFVVATNPTAIDIRLVGAPFIYATDTQEFDFEFSKWNWAADTNNSQFMVQPYNPNYPQRFYINSVNTTHRMRWNSSGVYFESYYPASYTSNPGGLIAKYTYKSTVPVGNNFIPGPERVHINYWINTRQNTIPANSAFVVNCFKFCANANLATCSTSLGTKPRCSSTKTW